MKMKVMTLDRIQNENAVGIRFNQFDEEIHLGPALFLRPRKREEQDSQWCQDTHISIPT